MQLSSNIRSFRKERGLTQEQLAEALGVTASAVYKWEAGLSTPDINILQLSLSFFSGLRKPGQNSFLDKISTAFYVYLAAAQARLGRTDEARESLRTARALAEQFDRAPDYSVNSVRFVANDRPGSAFDNMGAIAMECILDLLETRKSEELTALWREIAAEKSVQG